MKFEVECRGLRILTDNESNKSWDFEKDGVELFL